MALVDKLVEYGASVEPLGGGDWASPLHTALVFGYRDAAEALVRHGARIRDVSDAAGLGRMEEVRRLLPEADGGARRRALALAAQLGHAGIVGLLLDAGEDPDRFNPKGHHAHATPLHLAALGAPWRAGARGEVSVPELKQLLYSTLSRKRVFVRGRSTCLALHTEAAFRCKGASAARARTPGGVQVEEIRVSQTLYCPEPLNGVVAAIRQVAAGIAKATSDSL